MAKTTYLNDEGKVIPAYVHLESATPQDTTVRVTANVPGATEHRITWPAVGSKIQPRVQYYKKAVGLVDDEDFADYWSRVGKEAWHNRQQKKSTDWLAAFLKATGIIGNTVIDGRRNAIGAEPVRQLPEGKEKNEHIKLITGVSTIPYMIPSIGLWPVGVAGASLVAGQDKLQKTEEKADGGKVQKDQNGTILKRNFARYGDNGDFNEFMFSGNTPFGKVINEFIHPVYKDTTNTYTDRRGYNWSAGSDSNIGRYINNNDTIYWEGKYITDNNKFGVSPDQLKSKSKFVDLLRYNTTGAIYNQNDKNTLTRLRLENKKQHGGCLMRQGGKIIEVPFEK